MARVSYLHNEYVKFLEQDQGCKGSIHFNSIVVDFAIIFAGYHVVDSGTDILQCAGPGLVIDRRSRDGRIVDIEGAVSLVILGLDELANLPHGGLVGICCEMNALFGQKEPSNRDIPSV